MYPSLKIPNIINYLLFPLTEKKPTNNLVSKNYAPFKFSFMKKIFNTVASTLLFMTLCQCTQAQSFNGNKNLYPFSIPAAQGLTGEKTPPKARQYLNSINIRAVRDFMKRYATADDESWTVMDDGGFKVNFVEGGIDYSVYYNKHGNWTNSLKMYTEDYLPRNIRHMVKREYYDHNVAQIYEIETIKSNKKPAYIIRMEDEHSFVFVRIQGGEMDVWKELEKQK